MLLNNRNCPVCGSIRIAQLELESMTSRIKETGGKFLYKCESCKVIFAFPLPTVSYDKNFYIKKSHCGGPTGGDTAPRPHIVERLRLVEKLLNNKPCLNILDVGCSTGTFLEYARARGHLVKGIEISEYAAKAALDKNLDIFVGAVEEADIPFHSIDFIHINHVLEHLSAPLTTLIFLKKLLKNDGILIVEVPNEFENLGYKIRRYLKPRTLVRIVPTEHSYFFNLQSLRYVLELAGYNVLKVATLSRVKTRNPLGLILATLQDKLFFGQNIEVWSIPHQ